MASKYKKLQEEIQNRKKINEDAGENKVFKKLPYTNIKKELEASKTGKVKYLVLYVKEAESFFIEYYKHFYKIKGVYKSQICLNNVGITCPICNFIEKHKGNIDKPGRYRSYKYYYMVIFNYNTKQFERISIKEEELSGLLALFFGNGLEPETYEETGFDIGYRLNDDDWPEPFVVLAPKKDLDEILTDVKGDVNFKEAYGIIKNEIDPVDPAFNLKYARSLLEFTVAGLFPDDDEMLEEARKYGKSNNNTENKENRKIVKKEKKVVEEIIENGEEEMSIEEFLDPTPSSEKKRNMENSIDDIDDLEQLESEFKDL